MLRTARVFVMAAGLLVLMACGGPVPADPMPEPTPGTEIRLDPDSVTTVELEDGAIALAFPAGAVEEATTLVVNVLPASALPSGLDADSVVRAVSVTGPVSLALPAIMSFALVDSAEPPAVWQVVHHEHGAWTHMPTSVEDGRALAGTTSFSTFALLSIGPREFQETRSVAGFSREKYGFAFPNNPDLLSYFDPYLAFNDLDGMCLGMTLSARDFFAAGIQSPVNRRWGRSAVITGEDLFGVSSDTLADYVNGRQTQSFYDRLVYWSARWFDGSYETAMMNAAEAVFSQLGSAPTPIVLSGQKKHAVLAFEAEKQYFALGDLLQYRFGVYDPNGYEYRRDEDGRYEHRQHPALVVVNVNGYYASQMNGTRPSVELLYHSLDALTYSAGEYIGVPAAVSKYTHLAPNPLGREVNTSGLPWTNPHLTGFTAVANGEHGTLMADYTSNPPEATMQGVIWQVWAANGFESGSAADLLWSDNTTTMTTVTGALPPGNYIGIATAIDSQSNWSNTLTYEFSVTSGEPMQFTDWQSVDTTANRAVGVLGSTTVTFTGTNISSGVTDGSYTGFNRDYFTPPLASTDYAEFRGHHSTYSYVLEFSSPVRNPVIHLLSLASTVTFEQGTVVRVSGQPGFTVSGNSVTGTYSNSGFPNDANGTVQLLGTFSTISFTATYSGTVDGIGLQIGVP